MKLSTTKPISSPSRIDKFPPPLMRFLRTNAGNKSRGRSKSKSKSSNSMFQILRKKNTTSIETKEPSSPKVTCMGQVRVKRSSKQPTKKGISGDGAPTKCRCRFWWVPHTEYWFRRKGKASKVSTKNGPKSKESEREEQQHEEEENRTVKVKALVSHSNDCSSSFCSTPPRNALLLTRCKSAPYSSSSLASRFWGSPIRKEETKQLSEKKAVSRLRFFKELEDSVRERMNESESVGEFKRKEDSVAFPIVLTRCKSERTRRF